MSQPQALLEPGTSLSPSTTKRRGDHTTNPSSQHRNALLQHQDFKTAHMKKEVEKAEPRRCPPCKKRSRAIETMDRHNSQTDRAWVNIKQWKKRMKEYPNVSPTSKTTAITRTNRVCRSSDRMAKDSCRGKCGDKYRRGYTCQCDFECFRYGECCKDYRDLCTSETSCSGRCFETHERGQKCHCDSKCMEYNECCSDFVASCRKDSWKSPTTFLPTTRSTSLFTSFTWKPATAKQPEFISDAAIQQSSASHLGEETKIINEPTKPRNGSIKVIKEPTTMNLISFRLMGNTTEEDLSVIEESNTMDPNLEIDESKESNILKELVSRRIKDGSTQPTFHDESFNINSSSLDKEETEATVPEKTTYTEISGILVSNSAPIMDPDSFDHAATKERVTPDKAETMLPNLNKKEIIGPSIPRGTSTDYKVMDKERLPMPPVNEDFMIDSKSLDKVVMTNPTIPDEFGTIDSNSLDREGTIKPTAPDGSATMDPDSVDKEETQSAIPEIHAATNPKTAQSFAPNKATSMNPDKLNNEATISLIPPEEAVTIRPNQDKEGTKPTVTEDGTMNSKHIDNEKIQTTVPQGSETMSPKILQSFPPSKSKNMDSAKFNNPTTNQSITPEVAITMLPDLNKEATTKHTVPEDSTPDSKISKKEGMTKLNFPEEDHATHSKILAREGTTKPTIAEDGTVKSESLDNTQTNVPEEPATIHPEISQSFAPNRGITLDPDNLDNAATIKPIPPEGAATILPNLTKGGATKPSNPEEGTVDSESLDKDITTKPTVSKDNITDSKILDKEGMTTPPVNEDITIDSKSSDKEGTTKRTVTKEDGTTDSQRTKSAVAEIGSMNSDSLDSEATETTVPEESATMHPEISQTFSPNKAITMDPDNLDNVAIISPKDTATMFPKIDKERTAKSTVHERSATVDSDKSDQEETQTTVSQKFTTMIPEISWSFAPNRETTLGPDNLDKAATKSITPEQAKTMPPNLDKVGTIKPIVSEDSAIDSKILDKEGMTRPIALKEDGTTDSKVLDKEETTKSMIAADGTVSSVSLDKETTKPIIPENSTADSKTLDNEGLTITSDPQHGTMDSKSLYSAATIQPKTPEDSVTTLQDLEKGGTSKRIVPEDKILDKEGTTKTTVADDGTMNSESLDNDKKETSVPEGSATMYPDVLKSFAPNRAITMDPDNLHNATTVQPIPPKEIATILPYLDIVGTTSSTATEDDILDSKSLDREGTTKPIVLQEVGTIHLNNSNNKGQAQPTIQEASFTEPDLDKEGMTKNAVAAGPVTLVSTLNKASMLQHNVLERTGSMEPANSDIEGIVNSEESITKDLNLKIQTVKPIIPYKYTAKDHNVTTPNHIPQDSDDNLVTNVTLPSAALRGQTMMKIPSYEDTGTRKTPLKFPADTKLGGRGNYEEVVTEVGHLNDPNLCNTRPSDAMTTLQNGTTYIFRGHLFWTMDQKRQALGNTGRISDVWGIPSPIDTVFTRCNCNGKTFFFKGEQYWRFQNGVMDRGYPQSIAIGFAGLNGKIRTALSVAAYKNRPETVYFFKNGGRYQKYVYQRSPTNCALRTGTYTYRVLRQRFKRQTLVITKTIKSLKTGQLSSAMSVRKNWHGFPVRVTSAISIPNLERAERYEYYVLSGDKYYTVDPANQKAINTRRSVMKDLYGCN
ncbi:proteoglycan 4b [Carcharodon carcharias]|uniref:proteoglycan 4b n=1 Tax=Carcharodon carcharias TaxID=13397 RepID=UPI001B7ECA9E|nr:proteoglycan 4b [Carcharodon carcharias]